MNNNTYYKILNTAIHSQAGLFVQNIIYQAITLQSQ